MTKRIQKTAAKTKIAKMIQTEETKTGPVPKAKAPKASKANRQAALADAVNETEIAAIKKQNAETIAEMRAATAIAAVLEPQGPVLTDAQIAVCLAHYENVALAKNAADAAKISGFDVERVNGNATRVGYHRVNPSAKLERAAVDVARLAQENASKTKTKEPAADAESVKAERANVAKTKRQEIAVIRAKAETERKARVAEKKEAKAQKSATPRRVPPTKKDGEIVARTSTYKGLPDNVMAQARTFQTHLDAEMTVEQIVAKYKLASPSIVRQRLQLLALKDNIQTMVENGEISAVTGWGIALAPKSAQPSIVAKIKSGELKGSAAVKEAGRAARDAARE